MNAVTTPVTPDGIRLRPDNTEKAVNFVVETINRILNMDGSVSLLLQGGKVEIFDTSNFDLWKAGHVKAVQMFKEVGWLISHKESAKFGIIYYFQLPAHGSTIRTESL